MLFSPISVRALRRMELRGLLAFAPQVPQVPGLGLGLRRRWGPGARRGQRGRRGPSDRLDRPEARHSIHII